MLHDLIVLVAIIVFAAIASSLSFYFHRPERFRTKGEWWKAEGMMLFFLAAVGLLILALVGRFFHTLR